MKIDEEVIKIFKLPPKIINAFRWMNIQYDGVINSKKKSNTSTIIFVPSERCNLKCKYCYEVKKDPLKIEEKFAEDKIDEAFETLALNDRLKIEFRGGEPFLEFSFIKQITEYVEQKYRGLNFFFYAVTNGTVLSKEIKEWLSVRKNNFIIPLSIDGNKKIQDNNRTNSFDFIDLDFFTNTLQFPYTYTTIIPENCSDLFGSLSFLINKGFDIRANFEFSLEWTDNQILEVANQMKKLCDDQIEKNNCPHLNFLSSNSFGDYTQISEDRTHILNCNAGVNRCIYTADERRLPCHTFVSSAFNNQNKEDKDFFKMLETDVINPEKCCKCKFFYLCYICVGFSYAYAGDLQWRNKSFCKLTRARALWSSYYWGRKLYGKKNYTDKEKQIIARILNLYDGEKIG